MIFPWEVYCNNNNGNFKGDITINKSNPQIVMVPHTDNSSTQETKKIMSIRLVEVYDQTLPHKTKYKRNNKLN